MLVTEKMRKVSIIIHQRRLANLIDKLGEINLIQIIKKRAEILNPKQITEYVNVNLEKIQSLQEKVSGIVNLASLISSDIKVMQYNFEGISIGEIITGIASEIEEIFIKKEELVSQIKDLESKLTVLRTTQKLWLDLMELKIDSSLLKAAKNIMLIRIGYISKKNMIFFKKALESLPHLYDEKEIDEENFIFLVSTLQKYRDDIKRIENEYHLRVVENFDEIHLEDYQNKLDEIKEVEQQKGELDNELLSFLKENLNKLSAYREVLNNLNNILRVQNDLNYHSKFVTIEGWVPNSKIEYLMNYASEITEKTALFFVSKEYTPEELPPSKFKHPKILQPFETLTRLYGIPNYKEIDPTVILTISFPILFGLMFGDIGHGLMLIIGALFFFYYKKNLSRGWRNVLIILMVCGITATISGFLYGEFFGYHEIFGIYLKPLLFSPIENMSSALKFSIIIGTVMLSLAFVIEAVNLIQKKEIANAFLVAIPKIFFYCGAVYMVFTYKFNFQAWFQGPLYIIIIPIIIIVFGKLIARTVSFKLLYPKESSSNLLGGGLLEGWETSLQMMSNVSSFCRIFALSMVHIGLTSVIILISTMSANIVLGSVILVAGHVAVVLFEVLIVFINCLRLHYYEFFGKFYTGDGIQYIPFSLRKQFSKLEFKIETGIINNLVA